MDYGYPGNVRELENIVERAVALSEADVLTPDLLPETVLRSPAPPPLSDPAFREGETLDTLVDAYEKNLIEDALQRAGGNRTKAAALLGVTFRSFRYRLKKYGITEDEP